MVRGGKPGPETTSVIDPRDDPSWFNGPPYALGETVFDEYRQAPTVVVDAVSVGPPRVETGGGAAPVATAVNGTA
jgi:hypothetical protein